MTDQYPTEPQPGSGPQSGPAGWGQPDYQPPPGPPQLGPKPPQRHRTWILVLAGVGIGAVLAIVAFVVFTAISDDSLTLKQAAPTTPPVTTAPQGNIGEQPEDTTPETTEASGVWTGAVGDGAVVAIEGKDAAEFTLVKVDAFKTASPYGTLERARHGWFVKTTMRFKGLQSGVDVNPYGLLRPHLRRPTVRRW
jgi:hypothetical protein